MADEEQNGTGIVLSGTRERQSWCPRAASATESMVSGVIQRVAPPLRSATRLLTWHRRFTQSVLPWPEWSPMSLDLRDEEELSQDQRRMEKGDVRMSQPEGNISTTGSDIQRSVVPKYGSITAQQGTEPSRSHPAIRLAVMRPRQAAAYTTHRNGFGSRVTESLRGRDGSTSTERSPSGMEGLRERTESLTERMNELWRPLSSAETPALETRLITSASPLPRQEFQGGFPIQRPSLSALSEDQRAGLDPVAVSPLQRIDRVNQTQRVSGLNTRSAPSDYRVSSSEHNIGGTGGSSSHQPVPLMPPESRGARSVSSASPAPQGTTVQEQSLMPEYQGAIGELIGRTIVPTPLPDFRMRMISPQEQRPTNDAGSEQTSDESPAPPIPTPVQSQAPQVDIDAVAEKVYQTLMRRQQLERERKGLY